MHLLKAASAATLSLAGMLVVSTCNAQEKNGNVAVVNGVPISQERMEYVVRAQVQQGQKDDENLRKNVREALITREILAQEAIKKGLENNPQFQAQLEMARQEFLIRAYFDDFIRNNAPTEAELQAEYERLKEQQSAGGQRKEYRARHILMKDEKKAKATLAEINKAKGKNFARLAKARSEDQGSKVEGGLLDWSDGDNYVKEFSDAMKRLKKGEWTVALVKTQFGYHIILLEDVRDIQFPPFDQVKDRVEQQMMAQRRDKAIEALRASATVE